MAGDSKERMKQFAQKIVGVFSGAMLTHMVQIGYRTGLFEAARQGPATCAELAERAGLQERYVREWLGAMTTGGIFDYDPADQRYTLPPEHAMYLTGDGATNVAPVSTLISSVAKGMPHLLECFRNGGGVHSDHYRPDFTHCMDDAWRRIFDDRLTDGFLDQVPGLIERLRGGIRVMELGCGTGHVANLLANEFPASQIVGYDVAEDALEAARAEAARMGLKNVEFRNEDLTHAKQEPQFDLITAFDVIHDLPQPRPMLERLHEALRPDGLLFLVEFKFSSKLENNVGNPFAPMMYGISTMYCTTVSLAHGGEGLGACWGEETAHAYLAAAGFKGIRSVDCPRPQNVIYVASP